MIDHYVAGGIENPNTDPVIKPLSLSAQEQADLIAFLESLTDDAFLHDARFSAPK